MTTPIRRRAAVVAAATSVLAVLGATAPAEAAPTPQAAACTNIEVYNSYLSIRNVPLRGEGETVTFVPVDATSRKPYRYINIVGGYDVFLRSNAAGDNGTVLRTTEWRRISRWTCTTTTKWFVTYDRDGYFGSAPALAKANAEADAALR